MGLLYLKVSMPPKVQTKTKEAKMKAATASRGKKKKWSKGKVREKLNNAVYFNKGLYDRLLKEIPTSKMITPSVISERLKVNGSLARAAIRELASKKLIRQVIHHSAQEIYTRNVTADDDKE